MFGPDGQSELTSRRGLALEWFSQLQAPIKRVFTFENAAHSVSLEELEAFHQILRDDRAGDLRDALTRAVMRA